jgi:DNA-binding NarL/FixJ family response regulator
MSAQSYPPLRCLIVDDSASFIHAATAMLAGSHVVIVGAACTGAEAIDGTIRLHPDVVLLDVDLGAESGFDVAGRLRSAGVPAVILMSSHAEQDLIDLIEASSALGFIPKSH